MELTTLLPMARPRLSVNLSFFDAAMVAAHSAALPTKGIKIKPMNCFEIPPLLANPSIESRNHPAVIAMNALTTIRRTIAVALDSSGTLLPSSLLDCGSTSSSAGVVPKAFSPPFSPREEYVVVRVVN